MRQASLKIGVVRGSPHNKPFGRVENRLYAHKLPFRIFDRNAWRIVFTIEVSFAFYLGRDFLLKDGSREIAVVILVSENCGHLHGVKCAAIERAVLEYAWAHFEHSAVRELHVPEPAYIRKPIWLEVPKCKYSTRVGDSGNARHGKPLSITVRPSAVNSSRGRYPRSDVGASKTANCCGCVGRCVAFAGPILDVESKNIHRRHDITVIAGHRDGLERGNSCSNLARGFVRRDQFGPLLKQARKIAFVRLSDLCLDGPQLLALLVGLSARNDTSPHDRRKRDERPADQRELVISVNTVAELPGCKQRRHQTSDEPCNQQGDRNYHCRKPKFLASEKRRYGKRGLLIGRIHHARLAGNRSRSISRRTA